MKFMTKSTAIVAALAMATTGVLAFSTKANAATVATVHSGVVARLYTPQGAKISNRALSPNSAWQVGKILTINGEKMYQVSTNEYLRAADSSLNGQQQSHAPRLAGKAMSMLALYRDDTDSMANRSLAPNSEWAIGKYVVNKNGQQFVQVSTHEYADASKLMYTQPMTNPTYIADFGTNTKFSDFAVVGSGNLGTNGDSSSATDTSTDNNQGSTSTSTSTDPDIDPSLNADVKVGTNGLTYEQIHKRYPKVEDVMSAMMGTINAERKSRGLSTLVEDPTLDAIAARRAQEVSTNFTHYDSSGKTIFYEYLKQEKPELSGQGENLILLPWKDLTDQTAQGYADVAMDNYRGEGTNATWNHYLTIINPNAKSVGIGICESPDGNIYSVEDFAR